MSRWKLSRLLLAIVAASAVAAPMQTRYSLGDFQCPACRDAARYRWPVKTMTDMDWRSVDLVTVSDVTVDWMARQPRPADVDPKFAYDHRISPLERQVFRIRARLSRFAPASDQDVHLDLVDLAIPERRMVVEVIDPGCYRACTPTAPVDQSAVEGLLRRFTVAREALTGQAFFRPAIDLMDAGSVIVTVTGVGFFDAPPGAGAMIGAPNGLELHPVLDVTFP
jgi:hypothetical protein